MSQIVGIGASPLRKEDLRFVSGRGPKGEVQWRGFRVINNGDAVVVTGPARLLRRPDAAQMAEPTEVASKPEEVFKKKR